MLQIHVHVIHVHVMYMLHVTCTCICYSTCYTCTVKVETCAAFNSFKREAMCPGTNMQ